MRMSGFRSCNPHKLEQQSGMNNLPDPRNDTGIVPCVDPDPQTSKPPHNYDYIKKLREDRTLSTQFRNASAKLETIAATIHQLQTEPRQYTLNEVRAATDCVFTDTMGLTGDYRNRKLNLMLKDIEVKGTESKYFIRVMQNLTSGLV
uniref:hypothetical protein n=1 Tax=Arctium tomentosum TaxID=4218 RepID=UPI001D124700|nr:hypothetical protein LK293_mgp047 [Arctium tomentosum]YP_010194978.1 hypothetical protein LK294_mgp048 [Arctium lappa]QZZ81587.1 hypothetical protein [Arctium tomentosum]QZZ81717.1 hypothetical protein [Arctium lappa]